MKHGILHISHNSIKFKMIMILLVIMIPLLAMMFFNDFYAIQVVHNQVAESYKNMISMYMKQIDNNLEDVDKYLSNLEALNNDLGIMGYSSTGEDNYNLAKIRLYEKIVGDINMFKSISSIFSYSVSRDDYMEVNNEAGIYGDREEVKAYIINDEIKNRSDSGNLQNSNWCVRKIGKEYYLLRIMKMGDIYLGSYGNVKNLVALLNLMDVGQNIDSLLVTDIGEPMMNKQLIRDNNINLNLNFNKYHILGDKNKYLTVGSKSLQGNFSLVALIPDKKILEKLPYFNWGITLISIAFIVLLPICFLILKKILLNPLKHMVSAMKRIENGNLEVRIEPYDTSEEFQIVNTAFNKMIDKVNELKINIYEEKLNRQKAELQHLQLQINPHFFLNTLNIIYALARAKNYEIIQEMTLCLIKYFRYMFKSNLTFVLLRDELQHVRNYLHIQELRFDHTLNYEIEVPEFLMDTHVPPLIIHTFIENSIKYAITLDKPIQISVNGEFVENVESETYLELTIQDSGDGFKEEVLKELQVGNRITDEQGEHIGIWNLQQRLMLLYNGRAHISFSNGIPNGAEIKILLPLE